MSSTASIKSSSSPFHPGVASSKPSASRNRISIGIPVQVSGTDLNGNDFLERTRTEHINRDGAALLLNRFLGPDQQITIRRLGSRFEATARIIGQIGIRSDGFIYGIAISGGDANFWGVHFPPGNDVRQISQIQCTCCMSIESMEMTEIEKSVLEANNIISRACHECNAITFWRPLASESEAKPVMSSNSKPNRRKSVRTSMKASACLCQPTGLRDVAGLLDISRAGICFRSTQSYTVHSWVEMAVPYTEGGANIFVPARIVWERPASNGFREYGVQYVRN